MVHTKKIFVIGTALVTVLSGCRSAKLASRPLNAEEQRWQTVIQENYSAWKIPYLSPLQELQNAPATVQEWESAPVMVVPTPASSLQSLPEPPQEIELMPVGEFDNTLPEQKHTVKKNETLTSLARQFYGKASEWRRIFEANRQILSSPDKLQPGMILTIPDAETSN